MSKPAFVLLQPTPVLLAGMGRRLFALGYEILLLMAIILVAGGIFQFLFSNISTNKRLSNILFIYEVILVFVYFGFCWVKAGQTLAMKTWRIRLECCDANLISWKQAAVRYGIIFFAVMPLIPISIFTLHRLLPRYCVWLALGWALLPYLWALVDMEKQFLHDRLIGARLRLAPCKNYREKA